MKKMQYSRFTRPGLLRLIKYILIGVGSFSVGLLVSTIVLSSISLNSWKNFDTSKFKNISVKIPRIYIVQSGSMEPAIKTGSVVVSYPRPNYLQGDIITFAANSDLKRLITHRIMIKKFPEGINSEPVYLTAGDANEDFDSWEIRNKDIVGKNVLTIPYLGYLANKAKQPYGFILLVIVPATIIIYEELKGLLKEIFALLWTVFSKLFRRNRNLRSGFGLGMTLRDKRHKGLPKISAIIPVFGAALVFTGVASSFFSDIESSIANLFQAGEWSPPIAQTLVINEVLYDTNCTNPDDKQYIELWNGSGLTVNLQDWSLRDQNGNTIQIVNSQTNLDPSKFALISKSQAGWGDSCFGPLLTGVIAANLGGQVDIDAFGGSIKLLDSQLNVIDRVDYGTMSGILTGINLSTERKILGQDSVLGDLFDVNDFEIRKPATAGFALPQNQNVVINEFVVDDGSSGQGDDWVEVYNKSGSTIDIGGWTLRDTTSTFHTFPSPTNLTTGTFAVTAIMNNRLDNGGDKIYLFDSGGALVDGISYYLFVPTQTNSIGRSPDGTNTWNQITTPTLGNSNNSGVAWP